MMNANSGTMTVIGGTCNVSPAASAAANTTAVTPATTDHNKEESVINNNVNKKRSISDATSTAAAAIGTAVYKGQVTIVPSSIKYHLVNRHHHPSSETSKNLKRKGEDPLSCLSPVLKKKPRILENNNKKKEQQCNVRWNDRANIIYTQEDPLNLYPNEYKDTDVWYTVSHYIRRIACCCYSFCFWY
jgi:hypothetical protein